MKTKFLLAFLLLILTALNRPMAQFSLSFNIGTQPMWGPVGYDYVENYYLPDIEAYYNVNKRQYTYLQDGKWIVTISLPLRYRSYNLYTGYKVVVNEPNPYLRNDEYRARYLPYRGRPGQDAIRDSHDQIYYENRNHPRHKEWKDNGHDNGNRGKKDKDKKDKDHDDNN